ncbi:MAG: cyclase family protein [Proteobacteria bacterium]|nr:cyclase family protein [Pseudomonadota bacterium]
MHKFVSSSLRDYPATAFLILSLFATNSHAAEKPGQWIDLSHDFSADTIYWPTSEPFKMEAVSEGKTEKGYYYSAYKFCAAEHGGTHLDAPIHFSEGKPTVDQIPLSSLIGKSIKIDVSKKALLDRDYQIGVGDLTAWEARHGKIPDDAIVLLETGYSRHWPDRVKYLGTDKKGAEGVAELHFPGLDPKAAEWLVNNRKIKAVGLDTASIDYGQSKLFQSHVILLGHEIPVFENIDHLDLVPHKGAEIVALPMKIKGGSGAPLRVVAFVTKTPD